MPLVSGTRLGPYEIIAAIAAGGMGEVYKARDTRLDRTVAIKVLPAEWAESAAMKQRFDREAQVIASLTHPNICKLHDVGIETVAGAEVAFLVMEHLEGETLAERLTRGPVPVDEAVRIGIAIVDALDKAHRQGVVHRDLKPGNIMLTSSGPKLLDFGLAKIGTAIAADGSTGSSGTRRTPVNPLTVAGAVLGTFQYMAPEQLDGLEADARTDIFAFGVVLHEMITGRKAFEGKSQVLLISAIATADPPPPSRVQPLVSPALDHVVKTCLAKDPDDRWQTARDLLAELQWIADGGAAADLASPVAAGRRRRSGAMRALVAVAALLLVGLAVPAALYFRGDRAPERMELRVSVNPLVYSGNPALNGFFAVSPDGRQLVVRADPPGLDGVALYVGTLDFADPQRLSGTDEAVQPFWSADGRSIAFVVGSKLLKIEAAGGPAQPICEVTEFRGGTWNSDGTILFGTPKGLFTVPAEGGRPTAVTTLEGSESGHLWPRFLPDGRRYLYTAWSTNASNRAVFAGSLDSKDRTRAMSADSNVAFAAPGYVVFRRESSLYAQPFDASTSVVSGTPTRLADSIPFNGSNGRAGFDLSPGGVLAYYRDTTAVTARGSSDDDREWQLAWVNRAGQDPHTVGKPGVYRGAEVSPDGTRVAVHRHDAGGGDVWVIEPRGTDTRITFDVSHDNSNPVWSADGSRLTYASLRKGKWGLYQAASDGSGKEELLVESELPKAPLAWSPDGRHLLYWVRDPKTNGDLWVLPVGGTAAPLVASEADERHGQISPDGKWLAYASNLTGRREVYVQPFPSGAGRWQVSPDTNAGGDWPRWARKGNELLYHSLGSGVGTGTTAPATSSTWTGPLFSVPWRVNGSTFTHEPPQEVVRVFAHDMSHPVDYHTFAVSPDAERFLIFQFVTNPAQTTADAGPDPAAGLTVVMNWIRGLKK